MAKRKDVVGQVAGDNSALHSVLCLGCILNDVSTNQKTKTRNVRGTSRVCEVNGIEAMIQSPDENFILAKPPHSINHWQLFITGHWRTRSAKKHVACTTALESKRSIPISRKLSSIEAIRLVRNIGKTTSSRSGLIRDSLGLKCLTITLLYF